MFDRATLLRDLPHLAIGLLFNCVILLVMHLIVLTTFNPAPLDTVTSVIEEDRKEEILLDATNVDQVGTSGDLSSMAMSLAAAPIKTEVPQKKIEEDVDDVLLPKVQMIEVGIPQPETADMTAEYESRGSSEVMEGDGVEGAMDRLTFELARSLKDEKTLAVWLFDASGSQKDEREAIADRFDVVYQQLASIGDTSGLWTQAATFGKDFRYLADEPVEDGRTLAEAVRAIENDESGEEKTFSAVGQILQDYGKWRQRQGRWNRLLFIVTDERGDDQQLLDPIIAEAKKRNVRVFVVGTAAIFGKEKAFQPYVAENGRTYFLPYDAGPETRYPQLLDVAYWGGGDARTERMSAGYGPWALTRLCAETGGLYLVAGDDGGQKFDPAIMRSYLPDYRPESAIQSDLSKNAAVMSLLQAAEKSLADPTPPPQLVFDAADDAQLRRGLTEAQKPFAVLDNELRIIHQMLERGRKAAKTIDSARWKASYDLALGRILALRARAYGYNAALADMKSIKPFTKENSNQWKLVPDETVSGNPDLRKMAAEARELLEAVTRDHAGTPWALLAQRELSQPFGWRWEEAYDRTLAIESGMEGEQARLLLAEEQEKRRSMPPPKLPKL